LRLSDCDFGKLQRVKKFEMSSLASAMDVRNCAVVGTPGWSRHYMIDIRQHEILSFK